MQRYSLEGLDTAPANMMMVECHDGDWVRYADHGARVAELERERDEARAALNNECSLRVQATDAAYELQTQLTEARAKVERLQGELAVAEKCSRPAVDSLGNPASWQLCQRCESNPCVCRTGFRSVRARLETRPPSRLDAEQELADTLKALERERNAALASDTQLAAANALLDRWLAWAAGAREVRLAIIRDTRAYIANATAEHPDTAELREAKAETLRFQDLYSRLGLFLGTLDRYAPVLLGGSGQFGGMKQIEGGAWVKVEEISAYLERPASADRFANTTAVPHTHLTDAAAKLDVERMAGRRGQHAGPRGSRENPKTLSEFATWEVGDRVRWQGAVPKPDPLLGLQIGPGAVAPCDQPAAPNRCAQHGARLANEAFFECGCRFYAQPAAPSEPIQRVLEALDAVPDGTLKWLRDDAISTSLRDLAVAELARREGK